MKSKPQIFSTKEDFKVFCENDYIRMINGKIQDILVTAIVKEIKGKVEWR